MITKEVLEGWRQAKNLAICSFTTEPAIVMAIQEMYVEAKQLRRDNLRLLNKQDLLDALLTYVDESAGDHYLTPEMEEQLNTIRDLCDTLNIQLEN